MSIEDDLPEQLRIRREKRASLIERGIEPYPVSVPRTKTLAEIRTHNTQTLKQIVQQVMFTALAVELFSNVTQENFVSQHFAKATALNYRQ
jgi:lysyl-tRNA synthetase class II